MKLSSMKLLYKAVFSMKLCLKKTVLKETLSTI